MPRFPVPHVPAVLLVGTLLAGCASGGGGNPARERPSLITREEIAASTAVNAHELIIVVQTRREPGRDR